jgi:hypothetical protein
MQKWYCDQLSILSEKELAFREVVQLKRRKRGVEIQGTLELVEGRPRYRTFEASAAGVIDWKIHTLREELPLLEEAWQQLKGSLRPPL